MRYRSAHERGASARSQIALARHRLLRRSHGTGPRRPGQVLGEPLAHPEGPVRDVQPANSAGARPAPGRPGRPPARRRCAPAPAAASPRNTDCPPAPSAGGPRPRAHRAGAAPRRAPPRERWRASRPSGPSSGRISAPARAPAPRHAAAGRADKAPAPAAPPPSLRRQRRSRWRMPPGSQAPPPRRAQHGDELAPVGRQVAVPGLPVGGLAAGDQLRRQNAQLLVQRLIKRHHLGVRAERAPDPGSAAAPARVQEQRGCGPARRHCDFVRHAVTSLPHTCP